MAFIHKPAFFSLGVITVLLFSCKKIDLYEQVVSIPDHSWKTSFKPSFHFAISDTTVPYNVFLILRHDEKYEYNNIWLSLSTRAGKDTTSMKVQYELPLANSEGWLASNAMDDLYEHRIQLTPKDQNFYFRSGEYDFTIEQIMRQDPLTHVLNVGLRIEKKAP
jgi:gliding motility-associated lipoprotein GldH